MASIDYTTKNNIVELISTRHGMVKITLNGGHIASFDVLLFYDFAKATIEETELNEDSMLIHQKELKRRKLEIKQ